MRIITGKNRGRNLIAPKNEARPTLDRTKETLFDILQFNIEGKSVLDLFAGSGALGLEADSRGAKDVTFVDNDYNSIIAITKNCETTKCNGEIIKKDFARALQEMYGKKFDIIFLDPPYDADYCVTAMQLINQFKLLTVDGIVACEHSVTKVLPDVVFPLNKYKTRKIGKVCFSFYKIDESNSGVTQ